MLTTFTVQGDFLYITGRKKGEGTTFSSSLSFFPPPTNFVFQLPIYSSDPVSPLEIITLSSGDSIHPVPIEMRIKDEITFICDVMVIGDKRQFLTCLMTLKVYLHHFYTYITKIKNSNPNGKRKGGNEARPT